MKNLKCGEENLCVEYFKLFLNDYLMINLMNIPISHLTNFIMIANIYRFLQIIKGEREGGVRERKERREGNERKGEKEEKKEKKKRAWKQTDMKVSYAFTVCVHFYFISLVSLLEILASQLFFLRMNTHDKQPIL